MREVYCFNPENDMAMAQGGASYCAPPAARAIAADLSLLPFWYAKDGGVILTPLPISAQWLEKERQLLEITTTWKDASRFRMEPDDCPIPWGWSLAMSKRFIRWGTREDQLPDFEKLERIRRLSHRSVSIFILKQLQNDATLFFLPELPVELNRIEQVRSYVERYERTVLKAPWSGSGRGILWGRGAFNRPCETWSRGVLNKQGMIIAEQAYHKVCDLAMEFQSDGSGRVGFAGYSFFQTDEKGAYQGNLLLSNAEIERRISEYLPEYPLRMLCDRLERILSALIGDAYRGYLGIDMLVWRDRNGCCHLHPCVELNLRMNMGVVSRILYDRYLKEDKRGRYFVRYFSDPEELKERCRLWRRDYPLSIVDGRIEKGYLGLTPFFSDTHYHAGIIVE